MGLWRRISSLIFKPNAKQLPSSFLKNGSMLLEEFMDSCNGSYNIPIRNFSAKQILRATNNFDQHQLILKDGFFKIYKGSLEERLILVKKFDDDFQFSPPEAIRDIVITSQTRSHRNVARLFGCCLEFEGPALVYEHSGDVPLRNLLIDRYKASGHEDSSLGWKSRLRIAKDIANVVTYLHTALSRPVVHRDLKPNNIMVDQHGIAKLFDFSWSISISPEEEASGVKDQVKGKSAYSLEREEDEINLVDFVKKYVDNDQFTKILDPLILGGGGGIEQEQQLQAFLALALKCIQEKREDRPPMIAVAKELRQIERYIHP
ncbi:hypothetical protein F0562_020824 [Nyssa sinensis]|uniref:Protein kinase domain-containing protein n=1 Tax=Nyssa sinensis TaxID=561372 RepID=A0A5J5BRW4_9ASTE|nr:hypothetical protein F0562_020824 [Nyssa sinensis]